MKYEVFFPGGSFTLEDEEEIVACATVTILGGGVFLTEPFTPSIWHKSPEEISREWQKKYKITLEEWYSISGNKQKIFFCLKTVKNEPVILRPKLESLKEQLRWKF